MDITVSKENIQFFQCFSSKSKLHILELLSEKPRNIGELANILELSSTIITRHINEMHKAGIINFTTAKNKRGQQKTCTLAHNQVRLNFTDSDNRDKKTKSITIPIGQFSNFSIEPTCGLASVNNYIGIVDDPRYFRHPDASKAGIIWFQSGYIEYILPSYLFDHTDLIKSITISFEICSEYPRFNNDHPSDITFSLNSNPLGFWTSPGSFGGKKGLYTPKWFTCGTEYGLLKTLMINNDGSFIDGEKISSVTISDLKLENKSDQVLRIESPKSIAHPGGVTIFGKGFGNHNQDMSITVSYK